MAGYTVTHADGLDITDVDGTVTHYALGAEVPLSKLISRRYSWMVQRGQIDETFTGGGGGGGGTGTTTTLTTTLFNGILTASETNVQLAIDKLDDCAAPLASPTLTGTPAAPTAAADTNTTQIATTAFVVGQGYLKSSTASSTYAPLASPTLTGTVTLPTLIGTDATDSSSSTTGAFKTAGGMGIAKKLYVGTDATISGTTYADDLRSIVLIMDAL